MSDAAKVLGRRTGVRRRVLRQLVAQSAKGFKWIRMELECGHVAHRRDDGARALWAICETCQVIEKIKGNE